MPIIDRVNKVPKQKSSQLSVLGVSNTKSKSSNNAVKRNPSRNLLVTTLLSLAGSSGSRVNSANSSASASARSVASTEGSVQQNDGGGVGGGDDGGVEEAAMKKARRMMLLFIACFAIYLVLCILFMVCTIGVWGYIGLGSKLQYFIMPPNQITFSDVNIGTSWMVLKFLIGIFTHIFVLSFSLALLKGNRPLQKMMVKYRAKIFLWLGITSVLGLALMADSSLDYIISRPTVQNGSFRDTILLPPSAEALATAGCLNLNLKNGSKFLTRDDSELNRGINFIQINLKWFIEILCKEEDVEGKLAPNWKHYLYGNSSGVHPTKQCFHLQELERRGANDCQKALMLYHLVLVWILLDVFGIIFCWSMFYLHRKLKIVKFSPSDVFVMFQFPLEDFIKKADVAVAAAGSDPDAVADITSSQNQNLGAGAPIPIVITPPTTPSKTPTNKK